MDELGITKFHKRRKRTADGELYYVAEGFNCRYHFPWTIRKIEREMKDAIIPHMKGEIGFAPITTSRFDRTPTAWMIYVKEQSDFVMLRLLNPVIKLAQ